jgi:hypothetical protein
MNHSRRKILRGALAQVSMLENIMEGLEDTLTYVRDVEDEAYSNMSDGLRDTEAGKRRLEVLEVLQQALDTLSGMNVPELRLHIELAEA